jgi:hypothetical protein
MPALCAAQYGVLNKTTNEKQKDDRNKFLVGNHWPTSYTNLTKLNYAQLI